MSKYRPLRIEALEDRKLLAAARARHTPPAPPPPPPTVLVLDGTLAVDNNAATATENANGTQLTSTPVAGKLGTLGTVRGVWNETVDVNGNTTGLDTLRLRDAKGTLLIAFNNTNPGAQFRNSRGQPYYEDAQRLDVATGSYANTSETGTIELTTNSSATLVDGLTLHTKTS
jgi:hypothetical protein